MVSPLLQNEKIEGETKDECSKTFLVNGNKLECLQLSDTSIQAQY